MYYNTCAMADCQKMVLFSYDVWATQTEQYSLVTERDTPDLQTGGDKGREGEREERKIEEKH